MSCSVEYKKYLKNSLTKINGLLDKGIEVTSDGVDLRHLQDKVTGAYRTLDTKDLEALNSHRDEVLFTAVRKELTDVFYAGFSKEANIRFALMDVEQINNGNLYTITMKNLDNDKVYTFKFKPGTDRSLPSYRGKQLYVPNMSTVLYKASNTKEMVTSTLDPEQAKENGNAEIARIRKQLRIASDRASLNTRGAKRRDEYTHGDIDQMKRLLDELNTIDEGNAGEEYVEYGKTLLDGMHPHFFRKMDLFIKNTKDKSGGWINLDESDMVIVTGKDKSKEKSNAEVYLHEVVHSMTSWALRSDSDKLPTIRRELNHLFKVASERVSWQDYLDMPEEEASDSDKTKAKELYSYIFESENAKDEFLAHGLTHPKTIALLTKMDSIKEDTDNKTFLDKVMNVVHTLFDIVLGKYAFKERNNNAVAQLHALSLRLADINNTADSHIEETNLIGRFYNAIDNTEGKFADWAEEFQDKYFTVEDKIKVPQSDDFVTGMKFAAEVLIKAMVNRKYRNYLGLLMSNWSTVGIPLKAGGTVREFFSSFVASTDHARAAERLSLENEHLDTIRNTNIVQTGKDLEAAFKRRPNEKESRALTRAVLDVNLSALMYTRGSRHKYNNRDVRKVLDSDEARLKRRETALKSLKGALNAAGEGHRYDWVVGQSKGLGYFMATHQGHPGLNTNARSIVKGDLSNERFKIDADLVALVEEISVLTALQYTSKEDKKLVSNLMKDDWKGVSNLMDVYEGFKKDSRSRLFKGDEAHMMDGYSKEIFDSGIEIAYKPMSKRAEMESAGYEFKGEVPAKNGEIRKKPVGMFVTNSFSKAERFRGATNLSSLAARGTDLREIKYLEDPELGGKLFKRDKARIDLEAEKIRIKMSKGEDIDYSEIGMGMMPIKDATGKVVNYRYMMSKEQKEKLLGQETDVITILSRSMGSIIDKEVREEHNEKVLDMIKKTMKENWEFGPVGKDGEEFVLIGPESENEEMKELYYMLPKSFQEFINHRADQTMAVPASLVPMLFGYKHMMLTEKLRKVLPKVLTQLVNMVEGFWIELVKIAKGNILLKMPAILVSNIVSNFLYLLTTGGAGPIELLQMHKESYQSAKAYLDGYREIHRLGIEISKLESVLRSNATDKSSVLTDIKKKKARLKVLNKELEENSVHELFEAGLFQSVVEDVNTDVLGDSNTLSDKMDKVLQKSPVAVRKGLQWAYLSKETGWYRFNQEILQLSDLIARDVQNKKMKRAETAMMDGKRVVPKALREAIGIKSDKPVKITGALRDEFLEKSKEYRINHLLDSFINYNKPNGRFEEYLNRIGVLMFTKYVKRVQRVIATTALQHPIRSSAVLALAVLAIDLDNIQDQAFLTKGFGTDGDFSFTNVFTNSNPVEIITNITTPALVKEETYMGLI